MREMTHPQAYGTRSVSELADDGNVYQGSAKKLLRAD